MDIDLNALNLKDLRDLRGQVDRAISSFEARRKKAALAELEEKARELGFSLGELAKAAAAGGGKSIGAPKYADPANPGNTWTGKGRKPRWFSEAIAKGAKPEDMAL